MKEGPILGSIVDAMPELKLAPALRYLILQQNVLQRSIEFEFLPQYPFAEATEGKKILGQLQSRNLLDRAEIEKQLSGFLPRYKERLRQDASELGLDEPRLDHFIILSTARFSDYYYVTAGKGWDLIALGNWERDMAPPSLIEFFLALVVECAVGYALGEENTPSHYGTKGCLFDFTSEISDARYAILTGFICPSCQEVLQKLKSAAFLRNVSFLLKREWLGTVARPSEISITTRKIGHDLFRTMGFKPSFRERVVPVVEQQSVKTIFAILGGAILALLGQKVVGG